MSREELRNLLGGDGVTAVLSLTDSKASPAVYMTKDISPAGLLKAYQAPNRPERADSAHCLLFPLRRRGGTAVAFPSQG